MTLASAHPREGLRELRNNLYQYEADVCSGRSSVAVRSIRTSII